MDIQQVLLFIKLYISYRYADGYPTGTAAHKVIHIIQVC